MSEKNKLELICPACGKAFKATQWEFLNRAENPKEADLMMRSKLFEFTCPACSQHFCCDYPMLYSDPSARAMIQFLPETAELGKDLIVCAFAHEVDCVRSELDMGEEKDNAPVSRIRLVLTETRGIPHA